MRIAIIGYMKIAALARFLRYYRFSSLRMGMMCHQTAGNDALSRPSLRGTKQSRKYYNALFITGLLRKLAMTEMRDVIARWLLSVVEINEAIQYTTLTLDCLPVGRQTSTTSCLAMTERLYNDNLKCTLLFGCICNKAFFYVSLQQI